MTGHSKTSGIMPDSNPVHQSQGGIHEILEHGRGRCGDRQLTGGCCVNYNLDIRFDVNLHTCGKFTKFQDSIGPGAMYHLTALWCSVARQYPDGRIKDCTPSLIATLSLYRGKPSRIFNALCTHGWLDKTEDGYVVHDWAEHQPWVVGAPARFAKARKAGQASAKKRQPVVELQVEPVAELQAEPVAEPVVQLQVNSELNRKSTRSPTPETRNQKPDTR